MKSLTAALFLLASTSLVFSQAPAIEWQNTIGGNFDDDLRSVIQTTDGGYMLGGDSQSGISYDKIEDNVGLSDYWIIKLDASGLIQWQKTIGGGHWEYFKTVVQTTDGGYIICGSSYSSIGGNKTEPSRGSSDYWVVKIDALGNIEWQKTIGGSAYEGLKSAIQTFDGGYLLGGLSESGISGDKTEANLGLADYWVVKLNADGNIEWQNTIGGSGIDYLWSITQSIDGGYLLGGESFSGISGDKSEASMGFNDYWVIKLDAFGVIEWQNTIGGVSYEVLYSVVHTIDGGFILGGYSDSGTGGDKTEANLGGQDYWVVKINASGDIEWQNTIGGSSYDGLKSVIQTIDGGYLLGGDSDSNISGDKTEASSGLKDYWVLKLDALGDIEWQTTLGGASSDYLFSIDETSDDGYVLGGYSYSTISGDKTEASLGGKDYWVVKLEGLELSCSSPSGLYVSGLSTSTATLNWEDAGSDVLLYKLRLTNLTSSIAYNLTLPDGITSKFIGPSVIYPGMNYVFKLRAKCSDGSFTDWSENYFFSSPLRRATEHTYWSVFPNPSNGHFILQLTGLNSEFLKADIFDLSGAHVFSGMYQSTEGSLTETLNLNHIPDGSYLLRLNLGDAIIMETLIIQH